MAPYLIALFAMLFSALSAFTLITAVNRFDPPEIQTSEGIPAKVA